MLENNETGPTPDSIACAWAWVDRLPHGNRRWYARALLRYKLGELKQRPGAGHLSPQTAQSVREQLELIWKGV